jgi:hypothetical protein
VREKPRHRRPPGAGDESAVLLEHPIERADDVADRSLATLAQAVNVEGGAVLVSASVGIGEGTRATPV